MTVDPQKKIFVAGHRGLVGSAVVRRLTQGGYQHIITKTRQELDLFDQQAVRSFFKKEKPAYVILAAARVGGIKANSTYPADFLYENLMIQNNVIWSAHEAHVEKLLFLGSSCIYPRLSKQPITEDYLLDGKPEPTNEGYALAKIAGLKLCEKIFEQYKKPFISCMPTNIYGPGDNFDPESAHVIPALMARMHQAKVSHAPEVVIWGDGTAMREFLFVDDLADAIVFLFEHYEEKQFVNVGTGEDITIRQLAETLQHVVGYTGRLVFDATKPNGMPRKLLDVSKLHALGWKHRISFSDGLHALYTYYTEQVLAKDR